MKYNANFPGTLTPLGVTVRAPWASTSPNSFRPGQLVTLDAGSTLGAMGYPANGSREDIDNYFKTVGVGASISWGEVAEWLGLSRTAPRTTIIEALRRILRRACECHSSLSLSARVCLLGLLHLVEQRQPTGLARARLALRAELAQSNLIPLAATTETPDEPMTMRNLIAALGIDVATVETKAGISTAAAVGAIKKALHGDDSQFGADDFADVLGLSRTVGKAGVEARLRELASIAPVTLSAHLNGTYSKLAKMRRSGRSDTDSLSRLFGASRSFVSSRWTLFSCCPRRRRRDGGWTVGLPLPLLTSLERSTISPKRGTSPYSKR